MVNAGRKAARQTKLVVPMWGLHEANAKVKALEKENEQLKQELARVTAGGEAGTSGGKRTRTEPIDQSIEKALPRLPTEVWAEVAKKLEEEDLLAFALTSKQLREAQQQAERRLVTRKSCRSETSFSRDWCVWWSKRLIPTESAPEIMLYVIQVASRGGYVDVLKKYWSDIPEKKKPLSMNERTCSSAARGGHLEVLKWLRSQGCPWDAHACIGAAEGGHLELLKWLKSEGCPWIRRLASFYAAQGGHLEILRWLRSEGCPWDEDACWWAARRGHLEVLKWLRSEGCPWDEHEVCWVAAERGHLSVLKYLMSEGCAWDSDYTDALEEGEEGEGPLKGHIEALEWLVSLGHYTSEELRRVKESMNI